MLGNNQVVQYFDQNSVGRDFVVGDIHGCIKEFDSLLKAIQFNKDIDRMFSVGDLIDRGPDSVSCAGLMYEPWFYSNRANHEQMMIDALLYNCTGVVVGPSHRERAEHWNMNGGSWHHQVDLQLLKVLAEDFNKAPFVIVVGEGDNRINIVHAEIIAADDKDIDKWFNDNQIQPSWQLNELIWGRSHIYNPSARSTNLSLTIVGHTPQISPVYHYGVNHLYIDTGCVFKYRHSDNPTEQDRKLSCVNITNPARIEIISYSSLYNTIDSFAMIKREGTLKYVIDTSST